MKRIVLDEDTLYFAKSRKNLKRTLQILFNKTTPFPNPRLLLTLPLFVPFSMKYFFKITFETYLEKVLTLLSGIHFLMIADGQILTTFSALL